MLGAIGNDEAMTLIQQATASSNEELRDAAVRGLCRWQDFGATKKLLDLAGNPATSTTHHVLALQGVARLVESCDKEAAAARVDAALSAVRIARRPDEQRGALRALASVKDNKAVSAFKKLLADEKLRKDAADAALRLADGLKKPNKKAAKDLAQTVKDANISPALTKKAEGVLKVLAAK